MTDDEQFDKITTAEARRDIERREVTKLVAAKTHLSVEAAAEIVAKFDTSRSGALTMIAAMMPSSQLRAIHKLIEFGKTSKRPTT
jgi:hypothetical protein